MNSEEIQQYKIKLNSIKNEIVRLNDYLILNMNTQTSQKLNQYLTNKITEINNLIETFTKLEILIQTDYLNNL